MTEKSPAPQRVEEAVAQRYSEAARVREAALCCPTSYDPKFLDAIPHEVLEKDYGCGDPSKYLRKGETVLDLGSGTGKICFIAAQVVGPEGRVIGVDINDDMLAIARRAVPVVAERVGFANVEFRKGRIQDMAGVVEDGSVDAVVSNCVLNLVATEEKAALLTEIFRVLKPGGRAVISDIVSDKPVPADMQADPELWSGCISGAYEESAFGAAFVNAGFEDSVVRDREEKPWQVVQNIEFRSLTIEATKAGGDSKSSGCC